MEEARETQRQASSDTEALEQAFLPLNNQLFEIPVIRVNMFTVFYKLFWQWNSTCKKVRLIFLSIHIFELR